MYKVNRCLARYSPRVKTTSQPINRAPNGPAMVRNVNLGPNLVVFEQKIRVFYKMNPVFFIKYAKNGSFFINTNILINGRIYTPDRLSFISQV